MATINRATDHGTGWLDGVLVLAVLCLAGLLGCAVIRNSDIWMHFASGRLIANGEYKFGVDPFCHSTANDTWVNHAWGWDLGLFWIFQQFGGAGVVLTRLGVVLVTTLFLLANRRTGSGLAVPAMMTALALVASNGRLPLMQPTLWSYMCLAILMWLLHAGPSWKSRWLLPIGVLLLHVYWVNHDAWFIVGPFVLGLWAIGSLMEPRREGERSVGSLFGLLACGVLGCLANPHHVRAFVLPDDLAPNFMNVSISGNEFFESLQYSLFDPRFRGTQPAPMFATCILAFIGLVSFALNPTKISWRRFFMWVVLVGLATWRSRLIPFFAIGTTPLVVRNFQDFLAARVEPSAHERMVGITVRSVAAIAVVGLCFAAWPGWLGPWANNPLRANRVGLQIVQDAGLEGLARKLHDLQASGKLPTGERLFTPSSDLTHYMTWFAPKIKSFIDPRWRLHEAHINDFLAARQFFKSLDGGKPASLDQLTKVLKEHSIGLFAFNGSDRTDGAGPGRVLFTDAELFPLLAISGKATAFAWNESRQPMKPVLDPAQVAFAPQAAARRAAFSDEEPKVQSAWDRYRFGIPPRSTTLDEAVVWNELTDACQLRVNIGMQASALAALIGAASSDCALHARTFTNFHPATASAPSRILAPVRMACAVLAVRQARAAFSTENDNAEVAYRLAQSYTRLSSIESMLTLQYATALTQAKSRLDVMAANGWDETQVGYLIAKDLATYHMQLDLDLCVENSKLTMEMLRRPQIGALITDSKAYEAEFNGRKKQLEAMEKKLAQQRDQLDPDPKSPPINRMMRAEQLGLAGEALTIFQRVLIEQPDQLKTQDFAYAVNLMLRMGRAEDARAVLMSPRFNPVTAVEPQLQPFFHLLHRNAAVACGDYQRAREELTVLLDINRLDQANFAQGAAFSLVSAGIALDPLAAPALSRVMLWPVWFGFPEQQLKSVREQRFELLAWQAMLALEEGDTRTAKRAIDEALGELPPDVKPQGWAQLSLYKTLLDHAAQGEK